MKYLFLNIVFFLVAVSTYADTDTWVVLRMKGGMTQAYLVPGRMIIKTDSDSIRLTSTKMEVSYAKPMVEDYYFQRDDDIPTEIEEVREKGIAVKYISEDKVEINGITTNTAVRVYGINGIEYKNCTNAEGDTIVISLASLTPSTYIIIIEGVGTIKVRRL